MLEIMKSVSMSDPQEAKDPREVELESGIFITDYRSSTREHQHQSQHEQKEQKYDLHTAHRSSSQQHQQMMNHQKY